MSPQDLSLVTLLGPVSTAARAENLLLIQGSDSDLLKDIIPHLSGELPLETRALIAQKMREVWVYPNSQKTPGMSDQTCCKSLQTLKRTSSIAFRSRAYHLWEAEVFDAYDRSLGVPRTGLSSRLRETQQDVRATNDWGHDAVAQLTPADFVTVSTRIRYPVETYQADNCCGGGDGAGEGDTVRQTRGQRRAFEQALDASRTDH